MDAQRPSGLAEEHGVAVGAHPSFPDLQLGSDGATLSRVAPKRPETMSSTRSVLSKRSHPGIDSSMSSRTAPCITAPSVDEDLARSICDAILEVDSDLILIALAGSRWVEIAQDMGLRVAREIFADRALNPDGTLVSRSKEGSVLHDVDEVAERSLRMVREGKATAINGDNVEVEADSLCIHGDTPGAVEMARVLRQQLDAESITVTPLSQLV